MGSGCGGAGSDEPCSDGPMTRFVDPAALAEAMKDSMLSPAECESLCSRSSATPIVSTTGDGCEAPEPTGTGTDSDVGVTTGCDPEGELVEDPVQGCAPIDGAENTLTCRFNDCVHGRRPDGLRSEGRAAATDPLGRWFAEAAHLEAASVPAFERLAAALARHGAPARAARRHDALAVGRLRALAS